jgi:hypothetical protein
MLREKLAEVDEARLAPRAAPGPANAPATARVLVERYGEGQLPRKSTDALKALLRRLQLVDYEWDRVDPADRLDVAWVLWQSADPPAEHEAFLRDFLAWLDAPERRYQTTRLAIAWSAAFDPSLASMRVAGDWLAAHTAWLPDPWPDLARDFDIFSLETAPDSLAQAFFAGDKTATDFFAELHLPALGLKGGLGFEILAAAATIVESDAARAPHLAARLCGLAIHDGAFRPDSAPPSRAVSLRRKLAEALLLPWHDEAPPNKVKAELIAFLLRHYDDVRVASSRWMRVGAPALAVMRRWLNDETVACYFRLARQTKDADRARLAERETFWRARLSQIEGAWLVAGPQGCAALAPTRLAHGRLGGCRPDQAVLLLRVGGLTILESCHEAAEAVWLARNAFAPKLFRPTDAIYWIGSLNRCSDYSSLFNQKSGEDWQTRLGSFLDQGVQRVAR